MSTKDHISADVGDVLTALTTVTVPHPAGGVVGLNMQRGSTVTVTETFVEGTKDRNGFSWLSDLSEQAQLRLWGEQRFIVGDASNTIFWWQGDASAAKLARDHAKLNAERIADPEERAAAYKAIRDTFGVDTAASGQFTLVKIAAENPHRPRDAR